MVKWLMEKKEMCGLDLEARSEVRRERVCSSGCCWGLVKVAYGAECEALFYVRRKDTPPY